MPSPRDTTTRRRTVLKLLGAGAGAATIGSVANVGASESDTASSYVLEQGDRCIELTPLSGEETVEEFYDYRYPTASYDSVSGSNGYSYSSEGTTDLQADNTSILFLYDGPEGLSLVVVHGRLEGEDDNGGVVTFTLDGMPEDAAWVVRDDYYTVDGEQAPTNHDRWDVDGSTHQIDWGYRSDRTDGGAARALGEEFDISIDPAFNDDAELAADLEFGPIEAWEALSADGDSPERFSLQMDEPLSIRTGTYDDPAEEPDDQDGEKDKDDEPDDQDGEKDKNGEQEKHEEPDDDKDEDEEPDDDKDEDEEPDDQKGEKDEDDEKDEDGDSEEVC